MAGAQWRIPLDTGKILEEFISKYAKKLMHSC